MNAATSSWNVPGSAADAQNISLPEIVSADQFLGESLEIPPDLVEGMIHQGTLIMFAGGSKAAKSFTVLDLAISISQELPWWGRKVEKGRVLYVNFELSTPFLQKRLQKVGEAKDLVEDEADQIKLPGLDLWNLRGYAANVDQLMPRIVQLCKGQGYSMIILDPMYKLTGGRNENAAGEMCEVLNHFDRLAHETGAAVVYTHHFAKGLASTKEQLDRASGSGVFARHADAIITMTSHEEENAVVVEATLRNMRAPKPFVMRWDWPLMRPAPELDPRKLKSKPGAKPKYTVACVLDCLVDGMTTGDWEAVTILKQKMAKSTFAKWKNQAIDEGRVEERNGKWYRRNIEHTFDPMADNVAAAA